MAAIHSDEFKRVTVRIALISKLTRLQVASDLGNGLSTVGKWVRAISEEAKAPAQDANLLRVHERLGDGVIHMVARPSYPPLPHLGKRKRQLPA